MVKKDCLQLHVWAQRLYSYWAEKGFETFDEDTVFMSVLENWGEEMETSDEVLKIIRSIRIRMSTWHLENERHMF